jgi:hypothetical protein
MQREQVAYDSTGSSSCRALTGMELVRRDDEDGWQPPSRAITAAVPSRRSPTPRMCCAALRTSGLLHRRRGDGGAGHLMAIWGAVLLMQTLGSLPTA